MQSIAEAADLTEVEADDVTEAPHPVPRPDRSRGFHAVDYEEDGAAWERMFPEGDCLVLAVRETALSASLSARTGR